MPTPGVHRVHGAAERTKDAVHLPYALLPAAALGAADRSQAMGRATSGRASARQPPVPSAGLCSVRGTRSTARGTLP
eukprot:5558683-Prymnesium_polylepis.1